MANKKILFCISLSTTLIERPDSSVVISLLTGQTNWKQSMTLTLNKYLFVRQRHNNQLICYSSIRLYDNIMRRLIRFTQMVPFSFGCHSIEARTLLISNNNNSAESNTLMQLNRHLIWLNLEYLSFWYLVWFNCFINNTLVSAFIPLLNHNNNYK